MFLHMIKASRRPRSRKLHIWYGRSRTLADFDRIKPCCHHYLCRKRMAYTLAKWYGPPKQPRRRTVCPTKKELPRNENNYTKILPIGWTL
ncbi:hypothetical protein PHMEG_00012079 [Phytophthora megakarya]|uniref:Uncharacterized protein n=1 Tax=Phytophthora megakarya TaxID=4795 RepID=A0A225WA12_9STRA|nr:hypothetical protein PHMEG_00012079 [Phytophthora megakarya]